MPTVLPRMRCWLNGSLWKVARRAHLEPPRVAAAAVRAAPNRRYVGESAGVSARLWPPGPRTRAASSISSGAG